MALAFPSPSPKHSFTAAREIAALDAHFALREVPASTGSRLLLATWNIANFDVQGRSKAALAVIAHVLARFDLVAVQELNDKYKALLAVLDALGPGFDYVMNDPGGNDERLAFVYRKAKVHPRNYFGEVTLHPREYPKRSVTVTYRKGGVEKTEKHPKATFIPFDRNPFIGSFGAGSLDFTLVNVHLYFGEFEDSPAADGRAKYVRRVMEIYALSRWADRRHEKDSEYDKDIILLGDMNVPVMDPTNTAYQALVEFGWKPVGYLTRTGGSNLGNDRTYDQMVFAPGSIGRRIKNRGVFDFDNAIFRPLWEKLNRQHPAEKATSVFNAHVKHHLSDHRPVWVELDVR